MRGWGVMAWERGREGAEGVDVDYAPATSRLGRATSLKRVTSRTTWNVGTLLGSR